MLLVMQIVKPEAILASNTSSISITRIAAVTKRSSQVVQHSPLLQWGALHCHRTVHNFCEPCLPACQENSDMQVGMHFMNPVPVMPLVEIIRGIATSNEARLIARHPQSCTHLKRVCETVRLSAVNCLRCVLKLVLHPSVSSCGISGRQWNFLHHLVKVRSEVW